MTSSLWFIFVAATFRNIGKEKYISLTVKSALLFILYIPFPILPNEDSLFLGMMYQDKINFAFFQFASSFCSFTPARKKNINDSPVLVIIQKHLQQIDGILTSNHRE